MARRRLEAAILAGRDLGPGKESPEFFHRVEEYAPYKYSEAHASVYSLQYSPDAEYIAIGFADGCIQVVKAGTGELYTEMRKYNKNGLPITALRYHPKLKNVFLASSCDGRIFTCDIKNKNCQELCTEPDNQINCLDFNVYGDYFATAGKDKTVRIYDTAIDKVMTEYQGCNYDNPEQNEKAHSQTVFALRFHPEHSNIFVTGGWENHLKIWDMRTKEGVKRIIVGPHICGDSLDIKGPYVLTGSWVSKNALQVWDFKECRLLYNVPFPDRGDGEYIYCAQFCDKGMALAGGSGTKSVRAINLRSQQTIGEVILRRSVQALDCIRGGTIFCVGGQGTMLNRAGMA